MPVKKRNAAFRREQMTRDKAKRRKPAGPRDPRHTSYNRDGRVNERAKLRDFGAWL